MMDARELSSRIKALSSSVTKNEPASEILLQIEQIKKDASPTEEMLRTTKAGLLMGRLRTNPNKDIARLATEVVARWKKGVEQEKAARASKKSSASPAPGKPASPAPKAASGSTKKKFEGDVEKRTFEVDKIDTTRTPSLVRNKFIGLIYNGLAYRSYEPAEDVLIRAQEVEAAAFKVYNGESSEYKQKIRSLFQNLKVRSNAKLGQGVMAGEIAAERFVRMTSKELQSPELRKRDAELEKENIKNAQVPMAAKSISQELTCGNCKKKQVSYSQAQTRSADEPMTTFCECMNCGNRWKFS